MSTTTANTARTERGDFAGRTIAQWFALVAGLVLVLVGLLGFIADSGFGSGSDVQGDSFLGFEVNGWHNLVHILTGALLLAGAKKRSTAKTVTLIFGAAYVVVTLIGLIDGNDIIGLIPVNPADNVLHLILALASLAASFASDGDDRDHTAGHRTGTATRGAAVS
jgi:hypothetical protein